MRRTHGRGVFREVPTDLLCDGLGQIEVDLAENLRVRLIDDRVIAMAKLKLPRN